MDLIEKYLGEASFVVGDGEISPTIISNLGGVDPKIKLITKQAKKLKKGDKLIVRTRYSSFNAATIQKVIDLGRNNIGVEFAQSITNLKERKVKKRNVGGIMIDADQKVEVWKGTLNDLIG